MAFLWIWLKSPWQLVSGDTRKNIPFHISTDSFEQKLGTCSEKISLSLYNGHFIRRLAGKAGIKFPSRKVPPTLQRTLFRLNAGMAAKYFWTEFPSYFTTDNILWIGGGSPKKSFHFTTDIFSEKNKGLLEKSENKNAPGLGKSGSIAFCGYEILECSKHSRCPYTAAKWAFRPVCQSAHLFLLGAPKPL